MKTIPLVQGLMWIVGSLLIIPGAIFKGHQLYQTGVSQKISCLCRIVQTGPQRQALATSYLAELMQISSDEPTLYSHFDPRQAEKRVLMSPVIKSAQIQVIKPDTVYIDYTVRQPAAWLYDFENIALDEQGVPFPITPFFSPKTLPEVCLGVKTFSWNQPILGPKTDLALTLLKTLENLSLHIERLDLALALDPSLGKREIVVILKENGFSKFLRLTPSNFAQELSHYLQLRPALPLEPQVIDLRIPQMAFIESRS